MKKSLIMGGTEKRLVIGERCPPYIYWKILVGRASVPARTMGGGTTAPPEIFVQSWANSIDLKL